MMIKKDDDILDAPLSKAGNTSVDIQPTNTVSIQENGLEEVPTEVDDPRKGAYMVIITH